MFQQYLHDLQVWKPVADLLVATWWVLKGLIALVMLMSAHFYVRYALASPAERKQLHEGNRAFQLMRIGVVLGYALAILPAIDVAANYTVFFQVGVIALLVQTIAIVFERVVFYRVHRGMRRGDLVAGATLGIWAAIAGVFTLYVIHSMH